MSFVYETITDEIYLKVDRQTLKGKSAAFVTPIKLPEEFPIELSGPRPCVLTTHYENYAEKIKNFEIRSDDTWLVSFMKTGTTWTQEMIWLLKNNADCETAKKVSMHSRFPFLEICSLMEIEGNPFTIEQSEEMPSPRLIKSHLPIQLLPDQMWTKKPKIVYVKRGVKDVAASFYHHWKILNGFTGTMDEFIDIFVRDYELYAPFFPHVVDFCEAAEKLDNILVINYEDMKKDLVSVMKITAKFLDVSISESDIGKMVEHLSFKNMRENTAVNFDDLIQLSMIRAGVDPDTAAKPKFIRKGEVGSWKEDLTPEMIQKLDDWIKRNEEANPLIKKYF